MPRFLRCRGGYPANFVLKGRAPLDGSIAAVGLREKKAPQRKTFGLAAREADFGRRRPERKRAAAAAFAEFIEHDAAEKLNRRALGDVRLAEFAETVPTGERGDFLNSLPL